MSGSAARITVAPKVGRLVPAGNAFSTKAGGKPSVLSENQVHGTVSKDEFSGLHSTACVRARAQVGVCRGTRSRLIRGPGHYGAT